METKPTSGGWNGDEVNDEGLVGLRSCDEGHAALRVVLASDIGLTIHGCIGSPS
jgi:hypothetical protein